MKYNVKKVEYDGIIWDSAWERDYYIELQNNPAVESIQLQPEFTIIEPYEVTCPRCNGAGSRRNEKTGNLNKCTLCRGKGVKTKQGAIYTADFLVTYKNGRREVIDVKTSGPVSRDFPLRRKLFEQQHGAELVVMTKKKGKWVRRR
ncbi:DUF1064 domain-containing protein [Bacillus badius]|uniref:DUF1064 domain-containing protein n=1 Tax=Bacillus badius TaxID=1455 RepID=UPI0005975C4D|nr:DUF1064 domain-containing protein [Bacillus badius]MED4716261.1 DUF1064 domain-containing protein [Bacillus badius]